MHGMNFQVTFIIFTRWNNLIDFLECTSDQLAVKSLRSLTQKINRFFCQFLTLLQHPDNAYICCQNPDIITLDGLVLSIETRRIQQQNLAEPWILSCNKNER